MQSGPYHNYQGLNTAKLEVEATKELRQEVEEVDTPKAALADQIRVKEAAEAPSPSAVSSSHALRAKGGLLKNPPSPNKTAGLNWKVNSTRPWVDGREPEVVLVRER